MCRIRKEYNYKREYNYKQSNPVKQTNKTNKKMKQPKLPADYHLNTQITPLESLNTRHAARSTVARF